MLMLNPLLLILFLNKVNLKLKEKIENSVKILSTTISNAKMSNAKTTQKYVSMVAANKKLDVRPLNALKDLDATMGNANHKRLGLKKRYAKILYNILIELKIPKRLIKNAAILH